MEAYRAQVAHFIRQLAVCFQAIGQAHRELLPCPFQSAMIRDCIEKGLDVKRGGARYNFTGGNAVGTAIVADSLMAIKKFVFDEKKISMDEMIEILQNDFEGREDTRLMFLNRAPKYGNDEDEVDRDRQGADRHLLRRAGQVSESPRRLLFHQPLLGDHPRGHGESDVGHSRRQESARLPFRWGSLRPTEGTGRGRPWR